MNGTTFDANRDAVADMTGLPQTANPLYARVKDYILANIGTGHWRRDQRLPSENELAASLGASRMTIHRALRELTTAGFVTRVQGVGTFVAPPRPQAALLEINNISVEIAGRGNRHRAEVLVVETVMPTKELVSCFEMRRRRALYHSMIVHFEDDAAVQLEERFVNPALVPDYGKQDFTNMTTYDYLMRATPVSEVEHVISAVPADGQAASRLGIAAGTCCLLLQRRTWTGVVVATFSKLTYVGGRYSLASRYSPFKAPEIAASRPMPETAR
jgi:GntR family transcriptional regulator, histidine utilization repressor